VDVEDAPHVVVLVACAVQGGDADAEGSRGRRDRPSGSAKRCTEARDGSGTPEAELGEE